MIDFIRAKKEDAMVITHLRRQVWISTYRGIFPDEMLDQFDTAWHHERDLDRIRSSDYLVYRITEDAKNVGYLILKKGRPLLLNSFYILPEFQRCGIGRRAFDLILEICRMENTERFICHCHPQNENALAFYRRMGGRIIGRDGENEESWQDSVILEFNAKREEAP